MLTKTPLAFRAGKVERMIVYLLEVARIGAKLVS